MTENTTIRHDGIAQVGMMFILPRAVLSQNKTSYSHWRVYAADKAKWKQVVRFCMQPLHNKRLMYSKWRLTRRYSRPKREYDLANLVGGAKPLIDCLVSFGIIYDDAPQYFDCEYCQLKAPPYNDTVLELLHYRLTDG